ncbi:MAG: hypothetical protein M3466_14115 [Gemmatimonadota bacterium]|nr:hypothetical protein [Gemmatimonadota bacterium]
MDHLTEHGVMGAALLYESPFTDVTPRGPDGIFTESQVNELVSVLARVRAAAAIVQRPRPRCPSTAEGRTRTTTRRGRGRHRH